MLSAKLNVPPKNISCSLSVNDYTLCVFVLVMPAPSLLELSPFKPGLVSLFLERSRAIGSPPAKPFDRLLVADSLLSMSTTREPVTDLPVAMKPC